MSTETVTELTAETGGRWLVTTETACYVVDLDGATIVRHPGAGAGPVDPDDPVSVAALRRDTEPIQLVQCRLGESMILMLDIRRDGTLTCRMTTYLRDISCLRPAVTAPADTDGSP